MSREIDALEIIRGCCADGVGLPPSLQTWLGEALGKFLGNDCSNLEEAFGIVHDRGGVPWWMERAIRTRDAELRALAASFSPTLSVYQRARRISELSKRYESTAWPRDRLAAEMPEHYAGKPHAHLWAAFRSGAKMPLSERHLRNLLAE